MGKLQFSGVAISGLPSVSLRVCIKKGREQQIVFFQIRVLAI